MPMNLTERVGRLSPSQRDELIQRIRVIASSKQEKLPEEARLVAYFVPKAGEKIDEAALRSFLQSKLPAYMVPSSFVSLPALPLMPNGKVDRRALPAPQPSQAGNPALIAESQPNQDVQLKKIWQEVLRLDQVGPDDNFFDMGGHSLLAMQVISRIRDEIGVELPVSSIFKMPTLKQLSEGIAQARKTQKVASRPSIQRVARVS